MLSAGPQAQRPLAQIPSIAHQALPQQPIPLHVLAEIQRAMAHASVVAKQAGGVPCNPNDIFMQGADLSCKPRILISSPPGARQDYLAGPCRDLRYLDAWWSNALEDWQDGCKRTLRDV